MIGAVCAPYEQDGGSSSRSPSFAVFCWPSGICTAKGGMVDAADEQLCLHRFLCRFEKPKPVNGPWPSAFSSWRISPKVPEAAQCSTAMCCSLLVMQGQLWWFIHLLGVCCVLFCFFLIKLFQLPNIRSQSPNCSSSSLKFPESHVLSKGAMYFCTNSLQKTGIRMIHPVYVLWLQVTT